MKTIILSAGHGGRDPGATANGVRESDAVLATCLYCRDYLEDHYEGHRLILPRTTDKFVSLADRARLAGNEGADLYVSMHMNWYKDPNAHGFETFRYKGTVKDTTVRNQTIIHDTVYKYMNTLGISDRGKKRSSHWVVKHVPTSVVLVEYLFISNPREARFAQDSGKLRGMGEATAKGIAKALDLPKAEISTPVTPPANSGPLPSIRRRIGVEADNRMTDEVGYLINNATYVRAAYVAGLVGVEVTGHGDHIKIKT